jgi:DNA repair protein RadC
MQLLDNTNKLDIRERLIDGGAYNLSDEELVIAVLGNGTKGHTVRSLASDLIRLLDSPHEILEVENLLEIAGIGAAKACQISAALELGRRLYGSRDKRIKGPADVFPLIAHWADRTREQFITITLNGAHEVINSRIVTIGLINRTVIHPREVFATAIADRACALIVAHNHPSGRLEPSEEDIEITNRLLESGMMLGIAILDHVIFSQDGYFSFVEKGILPMGHEHQGFKNVI